MVAALQAADADAGRTPREQALVRYARKLTLTPGSVAREDLDALRVHGLTDPDLFDLVEVIAFFNLINRIADAFGVPFEPEWNPGP